MDIFYCQLTPIGSRCGPSSLALTDPRMKTRTRWMCLAATVASTKVACPHPGLQQLQGWRVAQAAQSILQIKHPAHAERIQRLMTRVEWQMVLVTRTIRVEGDLLRGSTGKQRSCENTWVATLTRLRIISRMLLSGHSLLKLISSDNDVWCVCIRFINSGHRSLDVNNDEFYLDCKFWKSHGDMAALGKSNNKMILAFCSSWGAFLTWVVK